MSTQAAFSAALLDPAHGVPADLCVWHGGDPTRRFAVYRNNVLASLVSALADTFPVVQALVGEAFFRAMAGIFVRESPPQSPALADWGEAFPDFVARFEPAGSVPYLADVARLELLWLMAFNAADAEPLASARIAAALADAARLPDLCFGCHPSVGVLSSCHPAASLWAAHQGTGRLDEIDLGQAESALVARIGLRVEIVQVSAATAAFITGIAGGLALGQAAQAALELDECFDLAAALAVLIRLGALTHLAIPGEPSC